MCMLTHTTTKNTLRDKKVIETHTFTMRSRVKSIARLRRAQLLPDIHQGIFITKPFEGPEGLPLPPLKASHATQIKIGV